MNKVSLSEKFGLIHEYWSPKIVGTVNDCEIKLAKIDGEFVWHHHDDTDEYFFVVDGTLNMGIRDEEGEREIAIEPGEFIVVPRNVEHRPRSEGECAMVMFERTGTVNTGSAGGERTVEATHL